MIGVVARHDEAEAVAEFFELFKTPWEMAVQGRRYSVLLAATKLPHDVDADLVLMYGSASSEVDDRAAVRVTPIDEVVEVDWAGSAFPIYTGAAKFEGPESGGVLKTKAGQVDYRRRSDAGTTWRIGYNLFSEVRYLLSSGQPAKFALIPTLELHIALLRTLLVQSGMSFVEVPPRPEGYGFICCLTHDIDFFGIRRHRWDRTLAGFAYRATVGTLVQLVQGRRTITEAVQNWIAAVSVPFVFAGALRDFWQPFEDYAEADGNRGSTYFLAPFKHKAGRSPEGSANRVRALPYDVTDIGDELRKVRRGRTEFAVHGIDAWHDVESGRAERLQLTQAVGAQGVGVRMHWLYSKPDSARCLEDAGFDYDSTCGYNDTVGFRAGTAQAFLPAGRSSLMELPLSIMDSAMFYPGRMSLSPARGMKLCRAIISAARRFGGALVINWHDRSLAPERLWGRAYRELLAHVEQDGPVWFATAGEAVDWFRWRRSIRFCAGSGSSVTVEASAPSTGLPAARLVVHRAQGSGPSTGEQPFLGGQVVCSLA